MPSNAIPTKRRLAGLLIAGYLGACALAWSQEATDETDTPTPAEPGIAMQTENEPNEAPEAAPPPVPTESGAVLDYEPTESISEDLSVSFPVDI
jgi:hypothetical protein